MVALRQLSLVSLVVWPQVFEQILYLFQPEASYEKKQQLLGGEEEGRDLK